MAPPSYGRYMDDEETFLDEASSDDNSSPMPTRFGTPLAGGASLRASPEARAVAMLTSPERRTTEGVPIPPAFSREKRSPAPDGAAVSTRARLAATAAGGRVPAARDRAASCDQQHHSEEQHPSRSFKEKVHLFGETTF